jgi:2-isopropylmalate synthase
LLGEPDPESAAEHDHDMAKHPRTAGRTTFGQIVDEPVEGTAMTGEAVASSIRRRAISIFDTTLRDGEQAPGNGMLPEQKLAVALQLEEVGVDLIEAGFPASSPSDFKAAKLLAENLRTARVASFCRAVRDDVESAVEAAGTDNHQIQVLATASASHLVHKRGISLEEAVHEVRDAVGFARQLGITDVSVALEDSSRGSTELLRPLMDAALESGATTLVVCDTSGCLVPAELGELVHSVRSFVGSTTTISVHCHDDMGLAVANALAGIAAGADQVQATIAGIGERAGNTALEELAAALVYKADCLGASTSIRTQKLFGAFEALDAAISLTTQRNKAIFGANAFATQAGIHQAGMLRNPETYEYVDPKLFGRDRSILVGRHSGTAVLKYLLDQLDVPADRGRVTELYEELIAGRTDGTCDTLDDLRRRLSDRFLVSR